MKILLNPKLVGRTASLSAQEQQHVNRVVDNLVALCDRDYSREWYAQRTEEEKKKAGTAPAAPKTLSDKEKKLQALERAHGMIDKIRAKIQEFYKKEQGASEAEKVKIRAIIKGLKKRANQINAPFAINGQPLYKNV